MEAEKSIKRLEEIASELEAKDIDIEHATKLFEEGVSIIKENYKIIQESSASVTMLKRELAEYSELDFDCLDEDKLIIRQKT